MAGGGWFIGQDRILTSEPEHSVTHRHVSNRCVTANLTGMLQADDAERKPVPIRPPAPRVSPVPEDLVLRRTASCEPLPKPIIHQRSRSLPPTSEKKKRCRHVGVRFVDSLGLDLEDVRLFKTGDTPIVPHHVTFRLLMAAEMADGKHLEISLPYLKPFFDQQPGDEAEFLSRLCSQKVCLERVLCGELGVTGITQVLNVDFEKDVTVRYSFTQWRSCTNTRASWVSTITNAWKGCQLLCDVFHFHLPVPPFLQPGAVLEFAIQYKVCGSEYWDNNHGQNYKLVFHNYKLTVPKECEDSMVHFI